MNSIYSKRLAKLLREARVVPLTSRDRVVIISDMHLGDGGKSDDFIPNSDLVCQMLEKYYLKKNFKLVLNGDIEELHRFSIKTIVHRWKHIYDLLGKFKAKTALYKIVGNHDHHLFTEEGHHVNDDLLNSLLLTFKGSRLLLFHGHQASNVSDRLYPLVDFILRYIATPLGIRNYTIAHDSRKQFKVEKRIYDFSRRNKIISLIGHTHRPLFESLSKYESLKYQIEKLCRKYPKKDGKRKKEIKHKIDIYMEEFKSMNKKERSSEFNDGGIYHDELLVPSLFNSGCAIGKRGVTALEIAHGKISLVHWFNRNISDKYLNFNGYEPERLGKTDYFRVTIKEEFLDYIAARTELLA